MPPVLEPQSAETIVEMAVGKLEVAAGCPTVWLQLEAGLAVRESAVVTARLWAQCTSGLED